MMTRWQHAWIELERWASCQTSAVKGNARLLAECLAIVVATTGIGALLGGVAGFLDGLGAGAAPGAVAGAALGAEADEWIPAALGLKFLQSKDPTIEQEADGAVSPALGISLYAPHAAEDPSMLTKRGLLFAVGYYN